MRCRPSRPDAGLSKLLRRNPTQPERTLWKALTSDRRFAGRFKRQTPVGRYVCDFVSFSLRMVIVLKPEDENEGAALAREQKRAWLEERDYRVIEFGHAEVNDNLADVLERLEGGTVARKASSRAISVSWPGLTRPSRLDGQVLSLSEVDAVTSPDNDRSLTARP